MVYCSHCSSKRRTLNENIQPAISLVDLSKEDSQLPFVLKTE